MEPRGKENLKRNVTRISVSGQKKILKQPNKFVMWEMTE